MNNRPFARRSLTVRAGLGALALGTLLSFPATALAQLDSSGSEEQKPTRDIFQVLIQPPAPPPQIIAPRVSAPPSAPPPPPPLQFTVKAIAGEAPSFVAVIDYKGQDYIVEEGWESDDKAFVVKRIGPNKNGEFEVEVYNKKTNRLAHKAYKEPPIPGYDSDGTGAGLDAGGGDAGDLGGGFSDDSGFSDDGGGFGGDAGADAGGDASGDAGGDDSGF